MALSGKGEKILKAMKKHYKNDAKAEEIFYAMQKKRKVFGTEEINSELGKWLPSHLKGK